MHLKKLLMSLGAGAFLLSPAIALADHDDDDRRWRDRDDRYSQPQHPAGVVDPYGGSSHVHGSSCQHAPQPPPSSQASGRYEVRTVQQWVEGRWVRDYVPETCVSKGRRGRKMKCRGAHYVDRWVPGYYDNVQQWVWVPNTRPGWQVSMRW